MLHTHAHTRTHTHKHAHAHIYNLVFYFQVLKSDTSALNLWGLSSALYGGGGGGGNKQTNGAR